MKVCFFEAGLPNFDHDAGSTAVIELCELVRSMGHTLEYLYTGHNPWGRESDLTARAIPFSFITATDAGTKAQLLAQRQPDLAIISRPGSAAQWLGACRQAKIPVVYFGHDIHHARLARGNDIHGGQTNPAEIKAMQALEQHIWKQSAAVLYPSQQECDAVNAYRGQTRALAMPIYDLGALTCPQRTQQSPMPQLLFVGGAHHLPNKDAIEWFAADILPRLVTSFHLKVVGAWPLSLRDAISKCWRERANQTQTLEFSGVIAHGELHHLYGNADLILAPLRYGAGVKRKVVEVLALARPVLSTPIGFEGIDLPAALKSLMVQAEGQAYAAQLEALLTGGLAALEGAQVSFAAGLREHYSNAIRKQVLENAFALTYHPDNNTI